MRLYLDNNATTQIHPAVLTALQESFRADWGNASSVHQEGQRSRRAVEEARERLGSLLGAAPREIVFTSGGTESNNAAIHGVALSGAPGRGPCHIVTTSIEHPSALEPVRQLEARGFGATFVLGGRDGRVRAGEVIDAIRPETRLVSVMLANNETGVIQPVEEIGRHCRDRGVHFHCDAVQGAGRIAVDVNALNADTLSISAHKMHGPKGIGALYVRSGAALAPLITGGAQERRRRAGTESVPLAVGFGLAATLAEEFVGPRSPAGLLSSPGAPDVMEDPGSAGSRRPTGVASLRDAFERRVLAMHEGAFVHGAAAPRLPNTASICFPGVDGEALVIALDLAGVAVSSGSACSSGRTEPSHVLLTMGVSVDHARSSVRFSLSRFSTAGELDRVVSLLADLVPAHRRPQGAGKP
jgi:cysteine desulfurase